MLVTNRKPDPRQFLEPSKYWVLNLLFKNTTPLLEGGAQKLSALGALS